MNFRHFMLVRDVAPCAAEFVTASDVVVIDHGRPALVVYAGFPPEWTEELRRSMEGQPGHRVSFAELSESRPNFIGARLVRNDCPKARTAHDPLALVRKHPCTTFGVTWNGGIAFTRNDYAPAEKVVDTFKASGGFAKPPPEWDPVATRRCLEFPVEW